MTRIYIAGPISAPTAEQVAENKARFTTAARELEAMGHSTVNPCDNGLPESSSWEDHMRADLRMMLAPDVHGVALLDGWSNSRGASMEFRIARDLGLDVQPLSIWLARG